MSIRQQTDERTDEQVTMRDVQDYCEQRQNVAERKAGLMGHAGWHAYQAAFEELAEYIATGEPPAERRR